MKRIPKDIQKNIPHDDAETLKQIDSMLYNMTPLQRKVVKRIIRKMRKKYPDKEFPDVWTYSIHSIYIFYKMKVLELFSGTESFSKIARERGHETFTIDIDPYFKPDLCINILDLKLNDLPFKPDIIWASPPCPSHSRIKFMATKAENKYSTHPSFKKKYPDATSPDEFASISGVHHVFVNDAGEEHRVHVSNIKKYKDRYPTGYNLNEFGGRGMNSLLTERFTPTTPPNPFEIKCQTKKEE